MRSSIRALAAVLVLAACAQAPAAGAAETGFRKPIRLIVPYAPGGGTDVVARLLAPGLSRELGQTIFIENKPGANGQIGAQSVKAAPADGSTLLFTVDHSLIIVPMTAQGSGYQFSRDFVALGQAFRANLTLTISSRAEYKDFPQFSSAVQREPLLRSYGVPYIGGTPEAVGDALGKALGVDMTAVPFSGTAPALQNLLGNQIPSVVTGIPEAIKLHRAGSARILAVTGPARVQLLPEVPTFGELGIPGLETVRNIAGFFAPKGLSPAQAREFNTALNKVLADPQVQEKLTDMSLEPARTTPEEASQEMEEINRFWERKLGARR